jgi:hypothetical protein
MMPATPTTPAPRMDTAADLRAQFFAWLMSQPPEGKN